MMTDPVRKILDDAVDRVARLRCCPKNPCSTDEACACYSQPHSRTDAFDALLSAAESSVFELEHEAETAAAEIAARQRTYAESLIVRLRVWRFTSITDLVWRKLGRKPA